MDVQGRNRKREGMGPAGLQRGAIVAEEMETTIAGCAVEVVTATPQVAVGANRAETGEERLTGMWLDGYLPADAEPLAAWRRDESTRFPARIWVNGKLFACDVVIGAVEWGARPGVARFQAQSKGDIALLDG